MTSDHRHAGFEPPPGYTDPAGRRVDHQLLGRFVGAAYDGCTTCQDPLLTRIASDPAATARLVELACLAVHDTLGGLPANLTDEHAPDVAAPAFRRLAQAGLDGHNAAMFRGCVEMTSAERRAAADTAADILIGHLHLA